MIIAICDDEQHWIDENRSMTNAWADERELPISIVVFNSLDMLDQYLLKSTEVVDLIILDVGFDEEKSGINMSARIRSMGLLIPILFISAHVAFASEGYYVDAIGYLIKPYEKDKLFMCLDKAFSIYESANQKREKLLKITCSGREVYLQTRDIVYMESQGHSLNIVTDETSFLIRRSLVSMLNGLDEKEFVRIHKAYIASISRILSTKTSYPYIAEMSMRNGKTVDLSIGRTYYTSVQHAYANMVTRTLL